jgi:hypothetical protein
MLRWLTIDGDCRGDLICTGARVAADADHAHVERLGELREPVADLSEADGPWHELAAILLGDHSADLFRHLRAFRDPYCAEIAPSRV